MRVTATAISLNVPEPEASASFVTTYLGFEQEMAGDGFVSLKQPGGALNLIFLRVGLPTFKPQAIAGAAGNGTLIVFVVEAIDDDYARLQSQGANIITPVETEPWGERYFQLQDPNRIVYQLVQWVATPDEAAR